MQVWMRPGGAGRRLTRVPYPIRRARALTYLRATRASAQMRRRYGRPMRNWARLYRNRHAGAA